MKNKVCCLLFTFIIFGTAFAQAEEIPEVISHGFKIFNSIGPKSALTSWVKDGSLDNSEEALKKINSLIQIENNFGSYQGYDLFKSKELGPRVNLYLITINFEKGVLFAKFITYKPEGKKEIVHAVDFNKEVDEVWPADLVYDD